MEPNFYKFAMCRIATLLKTFLVTDVLLEVLQNFSGQIFLRATAPEMPGEQTVGGYLRV